MPDTTDAAALQAAEDAAREQVFAVVNRNINRGYVVESLSKPLDAYRAAIEARVRHEESARAAIQITAWHGTSVETAIHHPPRGVPDRLLVRARST